MATEAQTLTIKEAAGALGVHPNTLYRAIADGELRAIRLGRRLVLSRPLIDSWLRTGANVNPEPTSEPEA